MFNKIYSRLRNSVFDPSIDFESTQIYIKLLSKSYIEQIEQSDVKNKKDLDISVINFDDDFKNSLYSDKVWYILILFKSYIFLNFKLYCWYIGLIGII